MLLDDILKNLRENDEVAYINEEFQVTYRDLYLCVNKLYGFLNGIKEENSKIIVYGHKSIDMIVSFLACSFAGITYIPLDMYMPEKRVNSIINQVRPAFIINTEEMDIEFGYRTITKKDLMQIYKREVTEDIEIKLKPEDIYYMIFTSGSTGEPKGVRITYENLNSFIEWFKKIITKKPKVVLNQAAFSFDLSVADIYLSLATGGREVVLRKDQQVNYFKLFEALSKSKAQVMVCTPSFLELLLLDKSFNENLMPKLEVIYFCGEILTSKTVRKLKDRFSSIKIINSYGPTEATVAVTATEITDEMSKRLVLPVGIVKPDTKIYIVDEDLNIKEDGNIGEILIVGKSVGAGYFYMESETKKRFIDYNGEKGYLTGDLGYLNNEMLYYVSRKDSQIKYRGYRIELKDIERNINNLKYVRKVVVVAKKDGYGKVEKIIAFVELDSEINELSIRKDLSYILPEYMIPDIKIVDKIPLNNNGKCDESILMAEV